MRAYIFVVSVLIGLSSLPTSNFLFIYKYSLNIEPAKAQFFVSFACFPICLKPLYGIFLDYMNFRGVSKHKVFVIFCFGEALSNFAGSLADPQTLLTNFALNLMLSFFFYSKVVVIDAFVVGIIRKFNKRVFSDRAKYANQAKSRPAPRHPQTLRLRPRRPLEQLLELPAPALLAPRNILGRPRNFHVHGAAFHCFLGTFGLFPATL